MKTDLNEILNDSYLKDINEEKFLLNKEIERIKQSIPIEKEEMKNLIQSKDIPYQISTNLLPRILEKCNSRETRRTLNYLRYLLSHSQSFEGFPFYILIEDWQYITQKYPPFTVKLLGQKLLEVSFKGFRPINLSIHISGLDSLRFHISTNQQMSNPILVQQGTPFILPSNSERIFIEPFNSSPDFLWSSHGLIFINEDNSIEPPNEFVKKYRDDFVSDMHIFIEQMNNPRNQGAFFNNQSSYFESKTLNIESIFSKPSLFIWPTNSFQSNIMLIMMKIISIINWSYLQKDDDDFEKCFTQFLLLKFKIKKFNTEVMNHSFPNESPPNLNIDRKAAADIRLGISSSLEQTIIYQMADKYEPSNSWRVQSGHHWFVKFINENGIDGGGLARDLATECALDLCSPFCGLVVKTPNGRNDIGNYRDCVIPISNPRHTKLESQYKFAGALIAICIRTGLVQQFNFAPIVWKYLISGEINIDMIFEIDENYKMLINSLEDALQCNMSNEEFERRFNIKFVVFDSTGKECPLIQQGKLESVSINNCALYISLANQFRLNEMKNNLQYMKDGFWTNLNFSPPPNFDWQSLEYAACGEKEISIDAMKEITRFDSSIGTPEQDLFWRVFDSFNFSERSLLLKFITGRVNLPTNHLDFIILIDSTGSVDTLPTASTCFHTLHYPNYTSFETAYRLMKIAIEYTGTIDLS